MEMWELVARECIRHTVARYNHAGDSGRFDDMVACFTDDGVLAISEGGEHQGHEALRGFFSGVGSSARPGFTHLRHCVTNLLIDVESPNAATAKSYFQVITDIGLDHWGRYRDRLVPSGDGWRFVHRSVRTDGYSTNSFFA
jgi:hypothetical protein